MPIPQTVTPEILAKHAHLSDEEVRDGFRLVVEANMGMSKGRWAYLQELAAETGITERQDFVGYLERLLEARQSLVQSEVSHVEQV